MDAFLTRWNAVTRKEALLAELLEQGFLLDKLREEANADQDIAAVEEARDESKAAVVLQLPPLNVIGRPVQILKAFGSKKKYFEALAALEEEIYRVA